jgi:hypothetical protein
VPDRADFLDRWRRLIAEMVDRLLQSVKGNTFCSSAQPPTPDVDAQKTAVLILAALHGGSILSGVTQDPGPLDAALDFALLPFAATEVNSPARPGNE